MPHTHTRCFRVRYYECDAHGHLNNANYLRYMQETAFDASKAAGYDLDQYRALGRLWLIRESGIEFLHPLFYNDRVQIKTWVSDFRYVTSRRRYEFYKGETLTARAYTDWAFIETSSQRPVAIPSEMHDAFYPEGLPNSFARREPFPKAPSPPSGIFRMNYTVPFRDIDPMQHVNNAVYLNYVTECGMQAAAAHGWSWERMRTAQFAIYLRSSRVQYLQPALLGDDLEIDTWVSDVRRATARRHYTIRRTADQALLARAHTYSVWVDPHSGAPVRIPEQFLDDFQANIVL